MSRTTHRTGGHGPARVLTFSLALGLGLTACTTGRPGGTGSAGAPAGWDEGYAAAAVTALPASRVAPFDDCSQLLTYYQANALRVVGPFGLGGGGWFGAGDVATAAADAGGEMASSVGAADDSGVEHSSTNVQEEGVDEADVVKTDGRLVVAIGGSNGEVQVVDVATEKVVSSIRLPGARESAYPAGLLLHGDTLVVLGQEWGGGAAPADGTRPAFPAERTLVMTVDLSDPSSPTVVGTMRIEGAYRSARMIDGTIRMVMVTQPPGVQSTGPTKGTLAAEEDAVEANKELIRTSTIEDWVPHVQHLGPDGAVRSTEQLLGCDQIARPRDPAGLATTSVLTVDVGRGANAAPTSATGLVASGSTVYASTDRLVLATSGWDMWTWAGGAEIWRGGEPANRTDLHVFDISDPDATRYVASDDVEGRLVNQWALDEQDGTIRVATTTDPPGRSQQSHSSLVVLREEGSSLTEVGRVDGLGKTEQIQSVRYLSPDLAAIVTFRQTDPLYLVDTSDPAAPKVAGELKIPGYSAYLHPVGEGWLLGVGQDADPENGRTEGLQVSLFDIRDLTAPTQVDTLHWPGEWAAAEGDHRAFLLWPRTGQVFLPSLGYDEKTQTDTSGVRTLTVGQGTLAEGRHLPAKAAGEAWADPPSRTMVIGSDLWTLSSQGLSRYDLATLEGGWAVDLP